MTLRKLVLVLAGFGIALGFVGEMLTEGVDPIYALARSGLWFFCAGLFLAAATIALLGSRNE